MKKEGYVVKITKEGSYLEVLDASTLPCCDLSKLSTASSKTTTDHNGMQVHDCSTCSGCSSFFSSKDSPSHSNLVTVLNKEKRKVNVGEKIEYSVSGWNIAFQVFLFLLLPILAFILTFAFSFHSGFGESLCAFISLASFILTAIATSLISRVFLFDVFTHKIV